MTNKQTAISRFIRSESGAVTVDWVVLTAGITGLGMASATLVAGGVEDTSRDAAGAVSGYEIASSFDNGPQPYSGDWLAPGHYDSDLAWVQQLSDASIEGLLSGYASYSDTGSIDPGNHATTRYHDQYWMAYNEAINRGIEIPSS